MSMSPRNRSRVWWVPALVALATLSAPALADPPSRVARISYLEGGVSFQPAGINEWTAASINRPLITGDNVYVDRNGRVELEVGAATIRLDGDSAFGWLNLDDSFGQIELTDGVLNLNVNRIFQGQSYEIDTPTLAFVVTQAGNYRIDIAPDGSSTMVTVFAGSGDVYGQNNASYRVRSGNSYRFYDSALRDYEVMDLPRPDSFDNWARARDRRYENSPSRRYVSEEMIGYAELDDYGSWSTVPTYGSMWFPSRVDAGWAPYRNGRWTWIDPWGWTWVDSQPWGFAPSHYGRWAYVDSRWGWMPGPRNVRPIYAPALVAFVGGSNWSIGINTGRNSPVGWFPLGPRDVYVPWYQSSRNYFTNVNVRNTTVINNVNITNVYNNYAGGRQINDSNYAYRTNVNAVTAVPRDAFINSRSTRTAQVQVNQAELSRARIVSRMDVAPVAASVIGGGADQRRAAPPRDVTQGRSVIARTAPPARAVEFPQRLQAIERNNNQPLPVDRLRQIATDRAGSSTTSAAPNRRINVVGGDQRSSTPPRALPARSAADRASGMERQMGGERATPAPGTRSSTSDTAPERAAQRATPPVRTQQSDNPRMSTPRNDRGDERSGRQSEGNERALPSSRFAPTREGSGTDRATPRGTPTAPARTAAPDRSEAGDRAAPPQRSAAPAQQRNAPAVEQRRAAPVEPRNAPPMEQRRAAPVEPRNAPQMEQRRAAPVEPRNAPQMEQRRAAPVEPRSAPQMEQRRAAPVEQRSEPQMEQRRGAPVQQRTAPQMEQRRAAPVEQRSAPQVEQRRVAPVEQRNVPQVEQRRAAPVQQRNAPPAKDEAAPAKRERKTRDDERND